MVEGIGDKYHRETKYYRDRMEGHGLDWSKKPEVYKEYPNSEKIELPVINPNKLPWKKTLDEAIRARRSIRQFSKGSISLGQLSYLLWASTGIQRSEMGSAYRTAPSAGALYPIETYLIINNVKNVDNGIYHYSIRTHQLEELKIGEFRFDITKAALGQRMCMSCAVVFIHTAIIYRSKWKYRERGYRYIYMDAGHIAENLGLTAAALDLGACHVGALFDDEVNEILGVDGKEETAIYLTVVGRMKE